MNAYASEIENILKRFPSRTSKQHPESYIGGGQSQLRYIGLKVPQLRQTMKAGFSFSHKSSAEIAEVWDQIWQASDCYEVMALALDWFYLPQQRELLVENWPRLQNWSARIDNWAHSDVLSGIYARILEESPKLIYPTLQQWNKADNPWLRRLSLVSLLYYSSARERVLPLTKILQLVRPQLSFDHYYVQKGVGWTLREAGNVYPKPTYAFIEKNITKISAVAFSAATEKMSAKQKQHLKKLRSKRT